ncbi:MAG TPA: 16S rRNA (guanine(966)-N(2))-methyltransferase RsmD [Candidatus Brocadiia bacterium]|nr:16S rRNA (guanine(966)-N(2))-methyltransferase RsmD [Planctomycetota bacterium]MDO8092756.1 16S rRNA (guanine(966)-N(2))-methyltransferase RsmD [Candidatus Brocadiales bacterium]
MRVIAGTARGTHLLSVKGEKTRPVLDSVKEALFNIIREVVPGSNVVDLFAGTGALGIEALSRGASFCIFIDKDRHAVEVIKKNLLKAGLHERAHVLRLDVFKACSYLLNVGATLGLPLLDLVLAGPPYEMVEQAEGRGRILSLFQEMVEKGILKSDGMIALQHRRGTLQRAPTICIPDLEIFDQRCYGETQLTFLRVTSDERQATSNGK